ncbi:MAG TPA: ROK family protein [Bryobacteraceae bacterium]|nr:ROK family protein [Bryobacteraceae bacterium]
MRKAHRLEELIFWYAFDRPACLRSDLGQQFGVSPATVSRAVSALVDDGLLIESSVAVATTGRKPQSLGVNPDVAVLLGLDIQLDGVLAVVTDMAGTLLGRGAVSCDAQDGVEAVLDASVKSADAAIEDAEIDRDRIGHLGVGHSGDLDIKNGVCVSWANAANWRSVPIRDLLQSRFGLGVTIDDRARAIALAERRTSPEDWDHTDAMYVVCASGIGMGFFVDGQLHRGACRGGGEIGHTVIEAMGTTCRCGNRGCVEAYAGSVAIVQCVREALAAGTASSLRPMMDSGLTVRNIASAARQGDPVAFAAIDRAVSAIGVAVANMVQVLNPSLVVLCGQLARAAGTELLAGVRRSVRSQCVETSSRTVEIRVARPKKDVSGIGCALLAAEAEAERVLSARFGDRD